MATFTPQLSAAVEATSRERPQRTPGKIPGGPSCAVHEQVKVDTTAVHSQSEGNNVVLPFLHAVNVLHFAELLISTQTFRC